MKRLPIAAGQYTAALLRFGARRCDASPTGTQEEQEWMHSLQASEGKGACNRVVTCLQKASFMRSHSHSDPMFINLADLPFTHYQDRYTAERLFTKRGVDERHHAAVKAECARVRNVRAWS